MFDRAAITSKPTCMSRGQQPEQASNPPRPLMIAPAPVTLFVRAILSLEPASRTRGREAGHHDAVHRARLARLTICRSSPVEERNPMNMRPDRHPICTAPVWHRTPSTTRAVHPSCASGQFQSETQRIAARRANYLADAGHLVDVIHRPFACIGNHLRSGPSIRRNPLNHRLLRNRAPGQNFTGTQGHRARRANH